MVSYLLFRFSYCFCSTNGAILKLLSKIRFWRLNTKAPHWREGLGMNQNSVGLGGTQQSENNL